MKPLRDLFHIKRIITEETKSGIYTGDMPANGKLATILAVNDFEKDLKVGDNVVIDARFIQEVDGDEEYLIKRLHIMGKIYEPKKQ